MPSKRSKRNVNTTPCANCQKVRKACKVSFDFVNPETKTICQDPGNRLSRAIITHQLSYGNYRNVYRKLSESTGIYECTLGDIREGFNASLDGQRDDMWTEGMSFEACNTCGVGVERRCCPVFYCEGCRKKNWKCPLNDDAVVGGFVNALLFNQNKRTPETHQASSSMQSSGVEATLNSFAPPTGTRLYKPGPIVGPGMFHEPLNPHFHAPTNHDQLFGSQDKAPGLFEQHNLTYNTFSTDAHPTWFDGHQNTLVPNTVASAQAGPSNNWNGMHFDQLHRRAYPQEFTNGALPVNNGAAPGAGVQDDFLFSEDFDWRFNEFINQSSGEGNAASGTLNTQGGARSA